MKFALAALFLTWAVSAASAADIAIALTNERVEVDTGFAGAHLTLFGAVTGVENPAETIDIISVIRGPTSQFRIRRLEKKNLIWAPGDTHIIKGAPGLYLTNATRPITDIATLPDQAAFRLGANFIEFTADKATEAAAGIAAEPEHDALYKNAFLTEIEDQGLYSDRVGGVSFKKGALFSIKVDLPATTPVGNYSVAVYLYRDGVLLGQDGATLNVNKVGVERGIYDLAHQRPVSYGILCVVLSLLAGWIASLAFRK